MKQLAPPPSALAPRHTRAQPPRARTPAPGVDSSSGQCLATGHARPRPDQHPAHVRNVPSAVQPGGGRGRRRRCWGAGTPDRGPGKERPPGAGLQAEGVGLSGPGCVPVSPWWRGENAATRSPALSLYCIIIIFIIFSTDCAVGLDRGENGLPPRGRAIGNTGATPFPGHPHPGRQPLLSRPRDYGSMRT